ncbi:hypothetical protein PAXINDRAFT_85086 [Paxillus involutus ATCC 200175]|uniref:Uncharacterized protein n=1 Tax=Paxillus involutus ATCC 200175 TaxID=664439 RepID=A0A0C9SSA9_PAXIN|nr:hypothetical protein PAXINDRAFT_85086 [Paxillus involutus ATCC 200175]
MDSKISTTVHASLEKHWAKADQDVFICAVVLNPFLHMSCFSSGVSELTPLGLYSIIKHVFKCIFHHEGDLPFHVAFFDYISFLCEYSCKRMQLDQFKELYKKFVRCHH